LNHELLIQMLIVSLVILLFLWHIPSALIPIFTLPAAVIIAFIPMRLFGINANIMSLGGIAVAIGALVDARSSSSRTRTRSWSVAEPRREGATTLASATTKKCSSPPFRRWGGRASIRSW